MILSIVIPALNDEDSIASIIERTLAASPVIIENTHVSEVEIIVVSDGSTDNTVKIAQNYLPSINLIVFEKNKGYGAAIKKGWEESKGELLAFLDADGTCDPLFFENLCRLLKRENADVVLGCRLNKESKMPLIRRVGNFIFATLLSILSSSKVKDTASGMRVIRKSSLKHLYPLPDGLHFTPAMSARCLLNKELVISEENMSYNEREGESKLSVSKDGVRFLKVIIKTAILYRPQIIINFLAVFILFISCLIIYNPILHYFSFGRIEDWMLYRLVFSNVLGIFSLVLFSTSFLLQNAVYLSLTTNVKNINFDGFNFKFFNSKISLFIGILLIIVGFSLVSESILDRISTGHTNEHWSRYIVFSFCEISGLVILVTRSFKKIFSLLIDRLSFVQSEYYKKI